MSTLRGAGYAVVDPSTGEVIVAAGDKGGKEATARLRKVVSAYSEQVNADLQQREAASRVRELGSLQAIGYPRHAIVLSLVQESLLASVTGALIGGMIADGRPASDFVVVEPSPAKLARFPVGRLT